MYSHLEKISMWLSRKSVKVHSVSALTSTRESSPVCTSSFAKNTVLPLAAIFSTHSRVGGVAVPFFFIRKWYRALLKQ